MEQLESLFHLLELGGCSLLVFLLTLRWQRKRVMAEVKKAEAEAKGANAEASSAEAAATKELQDVYQQLITDIKADRDEQKQYINELKEDRQHLRRERDELRERIDNTDETVRQLQNAVARNGRMVESMRPFLCGDSGCKIRQLISITENGTVSRSKRPTPKKDEN